MFDTSLAIAGGEIMTEKKSYKRLTIEKRKYIERCLDEGNTFSRIAKELDVSPSTIAREVKRNRRYDGPSRRNSAEKCNCVHVGKCLVKKICKDECILSQKSHLRCKNCLHRKCFEICSKYRKNPCTRLVCNGCKRYFRCSLERHFYLAQSAQTLTSTRSFEARSGFDLTPEEVSDMVKTVRAGFKLGHSIHHIFCVNEMPCSERTFYRLVEEQSIPIISMELAKKKKYKKRKRAKEKSVYTKKFYLGREYKDFLKLPYSQRAITTEVDTVWGTRYDKKCILSLHRKDLHFQIYLLLEARTTAEVVAALDWLEECSCGRFSEFFGLLLADRGSEFGDIAGIERSIDRTSQRCHIYFADPSRPDQRGSGEKNHVELRKVIPKGTSLKEMNSYILADICSHVNSTIRKGCGSTTPMQLAQMCLPAELLENLGLSLISPNEVVSTPGILFNPRTK